jgi:hypothetical protein
MNSPKDLARFVLFHIDRVTRSYAKPKIDSSGASSATKSDEIKVNFPFALVQDKKIAIKLIEFLDVKLAADDPELVVSVLRILQAYIAFVKNTWEGEGVPDAIPDEHKSFLKGHLITLMASFHDDAPLLTKAVAAEARALFVACLEEFFPTPLECGQLILTYCTKLANEEESLSSAEIQILYSSLEKIDSLEKISLIQAECPTMFQEFLSTMNGLTRRFLLKKAHVAEYNFLTKGMSSVLFKCIQLQLSKFATSLEKASEDKSKYEAIFFVPFLESFLNIVEYSNTAIKTHDGDELFASFVRDVLYDSSIVSHLAPALVLVLSMLSDLYGDKTASILQVATGYVKNIMKELADLSRGIPENQKKVVEKISLNEVIKSEDFESVHPISRGIDDFQSFYAEGATDIVIKCDSKCKIGASHKLVIYKDKDKNFIVAEYDGSESFGDNELKVAGDQVHIAFSSGNLFDDDDETAEGSDFWGYSLKVTGAKSKSVEKVTRNWLVSLQMSLATLVTKTVYILNRGSR